MLVAKCEKGITELSCHGTTNEIMAELAVITETTLKELSKEYENDYDFLLKPFVAMLLNR